MIVRIPIPDKTREKVWEWVKKHNTANRGKFDGSKEDQYLGKIAEIMTYKYLTGKELELKDEGFDDGVDFVYLDNTFDVKCMGRNVFAKEDYVNNFVDDQKDYKTDMLIFTSINKKKKVLEICGWIGKERFFREAKFYKEGEEVHRSDGSSFPAKTGLWTIENSKLRGIIKLKK